MLFWCCCPFLPFLCVLLACSGSRGVLCSFGTICRWRGRAFLLSCCPVVAWALVLFWYAAVGRWSAVGTVLLCKPRYQIHYVNHQTVLVRISTDFHRIFLIRTRDSKNTGQVKISARICSKSRLFLNTHTHVRESQKIFPEMTVFLIDMTHT